MLMSAHGHKTSKVQKGIVRFVLFDQMKLPPSFSRCPCPKLCKPRDLGRTDSMRQYTPAHAGAWFGPFGHPKAQGGANRADLPRLVSSIVGMR